MIIASRQQLLLFYQTTHHQAFHPLTNLPPFTKHYYRDSLTKALLNHHHHRVPDEHLSFRPHRRLKHCSSLQSAGAQISSASSFGCTLYPAIHHSSFYHTTPFQHTRPIFNYQTSSIFKHTPPTFIHIPPIFNHTPPPPIHSLFTQHSHPRHHHSPTNHPA